MTWGGLQCAAHGCGHPWQRGLGPSSFREHITGGMTPVFLRVARGQEHQYPAGRRRAEGGLVTGTIQSSLSKSSGASGSPAALY